MADPFIGEIRVFSFGIVPYGWAKCDGTLMTISQNQALFALLGVKFGGNGSTTFALPDLRGRTPVSFNNGTSLIGPRAFTIVGQYSGTDTVTLDATTLPTHTHALVANKAAGTTSSSVNTFPSAPSIPATLAYVNGSVSPAPPMVNLAADAVGNTGGGQGHNNMQPYLTLNFCIATKGNWPSRS